MNDNLSKDLNREMQAETEEGDSFVDKVTASRTTADDDEGLKGYTDLGLVFLSWLDNLRKLFALEFRQSADAFKKWMMFSVFLVPIYILLYLSLIILCYSIVYEFWHSNLVAIAASVTVQVVLLLTVHWYIGKQKSRIGLNNTIAQVKIFTRDLNEALK